jgi:hypothetical protein
MKNKLLLVAIFLNLSVSAQSFNEILEFCENGKKKKEIVKNLDLEVIKENEYNILGNLISTKNYDPSTKKLNGDFFNEDFKGSYDQGKLNCNNCKLYLKSGSSEILYSGNVINGFLEGKFAITTLQDLYSSREWTFDERKTFLDYMGAVDAKLYLDLNPRYTYKSGAETVKIADIEFERGRLINNQIFYNDDGEKMIELNFNINGIKSFVSYNEENTSISKDSIVKDSKIWKVDNRYTRSNPAQRTLTKALEILSDRYDDYLELISSLNLKSYGIIEEKDILGLEEEERIKEEEERIKEELGYSIENANKINDFVKSLPMDITVSGDEIVKRLDKTKLIDSISTRIINKNNNLIQIRFWNNGTQLGAQLIRLKYIPENIQ